MMTCESLGRTAKNDENLDRVVHKLEESGLTFTPCEDGASSMVYMGD